MLDEARRAPQTVTADWAPVGQQRIAGVEIAEIKNVVIRSGVLTECFRPDWFDPPFEAKHVVYMALLPGGLSSWHCHRRQNDIIIPVRGQLRIGLYDDRPDSSTYKQFVSMNAGSARPAAVRVPPLVWHGIKNPGSLEAAYIVVNDEPYNYEEPDDWILPPGSDAIPHRLD
ncbi:MAG: WxcM-like domain-containing protein [Candidatus Rokuibacteriota bacterium]